MSLKWIAVGAAVLVGSCAQSSTPSSVEARQIAMRSGVCFRSEEVNNVNVRDDRNAYVSTRRGYVYRLESERDCFRNGAISITLPQHRLSHYGLCIGEEAAITLGSRTGPGGRQCVAMISGPIRDSRVSGLWSRQT